MPKNSQKVYLDYAATTPTDSEVLAKIRPFFKTKFGNAMSFHQFGQEAMVAVDNARYTASEFLNCEEREVVFTSGATESNNTVLKGIVDWYWSEYHKIPHIIISKIEHDCVLESAEYLKKKKLAQVSYVNVSKEGILKIPELKKNIKPNTVLISVMYVNNEIGTIQPIAEIGKFLKQENKKRTKKIYLHSDAVQAINFLNCQVDYLKVDYLSLSGHKIYGPKGVGALYSSRKAPRVVLMHGGHQEDGKRAGTHNITGIVGLGAALEKALKQNFVKRGREYEYRQGVEFERLEKLRNYMIDKILTEVDKVYLNGSRCFRTPNNVNFTFKNIEGESILLALDLAGIAASTGSACSSGSLEPSHVIMAIGQKAEMAHGSVRFTLGKHTKKADIDYTVKVLVRVVNKLRKISPYKR